MTMTMTRTETAISRDVRSVDDSIIALIKSRKAFADKSWVLAKLNHGVTDELAAKMKEAYAEYRQEDFGFYDGGEREICFDGVYVVGAAMTTFNEMLLADQESDGYLFNELRDQGYAQLRWHYAVTCEINGCEHAWNYYFLENAQELLKDMLEQERSGALLLTLGE